MYVTIKMKIECKEEESKLLDQYQKIYFEEVKRATIFLKNKQVSLSYQNVSDQIHYRSKPAIIKEAKHFSRYVKVSDKNAIPPTWRSLSYQIKENQLRLYFGSAFLIPSLDVKLVPYQKRNLNEYHLRSLRLKKIEGEWFVYFCARKKATTETMKSSSYLDSSLFVERKSC